MRHIFLAAAAATGTLFAASAAAQDAGDTASTAAAYEGSVFDGDWASVGIGAVYGPSYDGSDDGVVTPLPIVQGSLGGVGINPRPGGLALDFLPDADGDVAFDLGVAARLNRNRATQISDPVVEAYGKLDTAIEVGPSVGIKFPALLNAYDSLSVTVDALWDVAGAHKGRTINPTVTYFTPLSTAIGVSLSASARHVDDDYARYYYSVPVTDTVPAADRLPAFTARGGFDKVGLAVLGAYDLSGDLRDGGLSLVVLGSYGRMLGDAKRTPFTSLRGDADQWMIGGGLGYTF